MNNIKCICDDNLNIQTVNDITYHFCVNFECTEHYIYKTYRELLEDGIIDYRKEVFRTVGDYTVDELIINCGLGLPGEIGEVVDIIKKWKYQGHELNRNALIKELGDVYWYFMLLLELNGISLLDVVSFNVEKLRKRYPNGFSKKDSIERTE